MNAEQNPRPSGCPFSMLDTRGREPFAMLEEWRTQGPVVRDERMKAWVVLDYELCKAIELNEARFNSIYAKTTPVVVEIKGGEGNIMLAMGAEHDVLRRFHIELLAPAAVEQYRDTAILPIIDHCLKSFETSGRAELAHELAEQIPPRVILALLGMPWQDDALVERTLHLHEVVMAYFGSNYASGEPEDSARAASREINEILRPYILAGADGVGDSFITRIWREAPDELQPMTVEKATAICRELFLGGSDTTVHGIANCLHLLLTSPDLRAQVEGDRAKLGPFVEETMRLYPAPQWRNRIAAEDCELAGVQVKAGEQVVLAHTAANRDPGKYSCPAKADLHRKRPTDHLAFNYGPRSCPGAALARAEMRDTLGAVLDRLPNVRLDPGAAPPTFSSFFMNSFKPLNVLFDV